MADRVPNAKCRFGRLHRWTTRGSKVGDNSVAVCSDCLLVNGTGIKADDPMGALFAAEAIASEFFSAPLVLRKKARA